MWQWIAQYWAEWAFGLLGTAVIAVVIKYKALLDGVLAILHDRIYQACQYYIKQGSIDTGGLKNLEYLYKSYHALGGNGTGPRQPAAERSRQAGAAHRQRQRGAVGDGWPDHRCRHLGMVGK